MLKDLNVSTRKGRDWKKVYACVSARKFSVFDKAADRQFFLFMQI